MWNYEKRLQFPVNIKKPDARTAKVIISQYGGPDTSNLEVSFYLFYKKMIQYFSRLATGESLLYSFTLIFCPA